MLTRRPAAERGHFDFGWLDTHHTFSFGDYHDARHMGFRALRVINDDRVAAGEGFPMHPHRDMEIVTYIVAGALEHKDSMGTGSVIRPGDVQRMSAGTGVFHSEFNHSKTEPVHLLQIWILPEKRGQKPGYEQRAIPDGERRGRLRLVGTRDGRDGTVTIHQDVALYAGLLKEGEKGAIDLAEKRHAWVQVVRGSVRVNGEKLEEGDGAAISEERRVEVAGEAGGEAEVLVFDLA